ncbi:MAG: radical SAM protein [Gammaproteobacteria bacterium]|nr:radical SAM protein [Gammaproteobacteria bacterium]MBI5617235.1 radical SAM protein [Gammaproteobacteria bacterium]
MPKLMIVQPTPLHSPQKPIPYRIRKRKLVGAIMPYLAALAPRDWDVELVDDAIEEPDYAKPVDVVAITVRTVTSLRAYEIARRFRERNVTVLMGGPHITFHAEEAANHADAICIGEGEEIFPKMLEDAAAGRLRKIYRRDSMASLENMPAPRWDLLNMKDYVFYRPFVIQHSRGCPFSCHFCAEIRLNGDYGFRARPIEEIVEDIRRCGSRHVFFAASQFIGNKGRTMQFLEALVPLKIRWSALFSAHFCLDADLLTLAKRSGLLHVNMGIESISQDTLKSMSKGFNKAHHYADVIRVLHSLDISYSFNFVLGADTDTRETFRSTLAFLHENKVDAAYFNLLVPLKGSPLYDEMKAEDRIIDEPNMERWPGVCCHFEPRNFTPEELVNEVKGMQRDYYSWRAMTRRLKFPRSESNFASWNVNLTQRKVARNSGEMNEFIEY